MCHDDHYPFYKGTRLQRLFRDAKRHSERNYAAAELDKKGGKYWYFHGFHLSAVVTWVLCIAFYLITNKLGVFTSSIGATLPTIILSGVSYYLVSKFAIHFEIADKKVSLTEGEVTKP